MSAMRRSCARTLWRSCGMTAVLLIGGCEAPSDSAANEREHLAILVRYLARPPIVNDRLK